MSHNTRSVICEKGIVPWCPNFGLLRTLVADDRLFNQSYVNAHVIHCVNLRHLSATVRSMSSFRSSINLIWNLHTLIVSCHDECDAPVGIWKMPQFRHIEFISTRGLCLPSYGRDDDAVMENQHTLKGVKNFKCGEEMVKRIPNLKKLKIRYGEGGRDDDYCVSNIKRLCELESLDVSCDREKFVGIVSLHKLTFPQSLKSLTLWMNREFEWEEMLEKIGTLPLLQKLNLDYGCFGSGKWEIVEGQFPSLKYLELNWCNGLKHWTTQESSIFPCLEHLHLQYFEELEAIPSEIGEIPTLQKIHLYFCSESTVTSAKAIVDEQVLSQGEQFPLHVKVWSLDTEYKNLVGPNLEVRVFSSKLKSCR